MTSRIMPSRYEWRPLELSPDNDLVGFDGETMIGRIFLEPRPRFKGLWKWSNTATENAAASSGYAASAALAVEAVETLYHQLLDYNKTDI